MQKKLHFNKINLKFLKIESMSRNMYWDMEETILPVVHYNTAHFAIWGRRSLYYDILVSQKYQWKLCLTFFPLPLCNPVSSKERVVGIHASPSPTKQGLKVLLCFYTTLYFAGSLLMHRKSDVPTLSHLSLPLILGSL